MKQTPGLINNNKTKLNKISTYEVRKLRKFIFLLLYAPTMVIAILPVGDCFWFLQKDTDALCIVGILR